ncbi:MAG: glycosyl hydrolase [Candidatus Omnitrophica bacterium]|nr:glycosyl hydrolase [Candidatus Omnitrophota bacterium]
MKINYLSLTAALFILLYAPAVSAETEIGAFVGNEDHMMPSAAEVQNFENLTGRHVNSVLVYWAWNDGDFPAQSLNSGVRFHDGYDTKTSINFTWEPWSRLGGNDSTFPMDRIINGDFDPYITKFAIDSRVWADPIRMRFAHEMIQDNDPATPGWYPWQDKPAEYVQAFNHVRDIFKKEGANNVEFVWCPNNYPFDPTVLAQYYPGKENVDWLGIDGYNSGEDGDPEWPYWQNIDDIFYVMYNAFKNNPELFGDKPIMLGEFASVEGNQLDGGSKAQWIAQAFSRLKQSYPDIDAFYWFDKLKEADWRIDSSPESLAAFQLAMQDPYYTSHAVPEPASLLLLGTGLLALFSPLFPLD